MAVDDVELAVVGADFDVLEVIDEDRVDAADDI